MKVILLCSLVACLPLPLPTPPTIPPATLMQKFSKNLDRNFKHIKGELGHVVAGGVILTGVVIGIDQVNKARLRYKAKIANATRSAKTKPVDDVKLVLTHINGKNTTV